jgi:hypothetical protein
MVTIDEAEAMLNEISESLPEEIFRHLNGGVNLRPDYKLSPYARADDLYILGEYSRSSMLGRYIIIYYGSFVRLYGHLAPEQFKTELKHTLCHELTHHLESLAGEKDLEIEDAEKIRDFLAEHGNK